MAWTIEVADAARKQFRKLGTAEADRITHTLSALGQLADPRSRGHALTGNLAGLWRYRIGDYRVIVKIEDDRMVILVVALGHRREVYRG